VANVAEKALEHRVVLGDALVQLGAEYPTLFVLTPDVPGSTRAIRFKEAFPDRYLNSGVSEANTVGIASGMAAEGWLPAIVGFAMFAGCKAWEQIRNSVAYPYANVKIFATHGGINVGPDGVTAQAIEDIALMRAIPGMMVLAPADANQVLPALRAALEHKGPVYVRMERAPISVVTQENAPVIPGQSVQMRDGGDATIIAIGGMLPLAMQAAIQLAEEGIEARVINMVSIKPLDEDAVLAAAYETKHVIVAEDHNRIGGVGSAVAEVLAREGVGRLTQIAVPDRFGESGETDELRQKFNMTAQDIAEAVRRAPLHKPRFSMTGVPS
jgi:transketolase